MDLAKSYGARELVTLGAYVTGNFCRSTQSLRCGHGSFDRVPAGKNGCTIMNDGLITGMNGLLLGMAKLKGLSGFTLLGETSGLAFDPKASGVVLETLSKLLGYSV